MQENLVSIIICSYNNWPDIELAIRSALSQSYRPIEVVVVDNSSADITPTEVPRLFGKCVKYMNQPNRRDSGAYNAGLQAATGEFIQFMDGDDVLLPHKIEAQVAAFREHADTDIVYGDVRRFQSSSGECTFVDFDTWDYDDILALLLSFDGNGAGLGSLNTLFSRSTVTRVGAWDEALYNSDLDYMVRAAWLGCRFRRAGGLVGFYRQRPGQMTANRGAMLRGIEAVWSKAASYVNSEPYRSILASTLTQQRMYMAMRDVDMPRTEALRLLSLAKAARPNAIPGWAYSIARVIIMVPGAKRLFMSSRLRPLRRWMRRPLRYAPTAFRSAASIGFE